jgi:cystathionine gamma-synthase
MKKEIDFSTKSIHGSKYFDPLTGAFIIPIFQSAIFTFPEGGSIKVRGKPFKYSREDNPTVHFVERKIALLEGGEDCLLFSSGMAAISTILISLLKSGDNILIPKDLYGLTYILIKKLSKFGIKVKTSNPGTENILNALSSEIKIVILESMSNPLLYVYDIESISKKAIENSAFLIVDNTFLTSVNLQPLKLGADMVLYSATKYLNGHNDITAGAIIGKRSDIEKIWEWRRMIGGILDPNSAYLLDRGLKTLKIRMKKHEENAKEIAEYLQSNSKINKVYYPGLPSHPTYNIAKKILNGFGGVISFELKINTKKIPLFLKKLKIIKRAPSLGGMETLIMHPASSSHKDLPLKERLKLGITNNLLRLSVGLEDSNDIIEDLDQALRYIS